MQQPRSSLACLALRPWRSKTRLAQISFRSIPSMAVTIKFPDGLRLLSCATFLVAEGGGTFDRVSVEGDKVVIDAEGWAGRADRCRQGQTNGLGHGGAAFSRQCTSGNAKYF
jgi:hypothetical protein